jgi:hypothetical protein
VAIMGLLATIAVATGVAACSSQPEIGSQADLDSLVGSGSARSVPPIDTVTTSRLPTVDPLGTDDATRGGRPGGSTPFGTNPPPIVVDTTPDHPTTPFCSTLAELLAHLATRDLQKGARDFLDDGDAVAQMQSQAPGDGEVPVAQLLQAVQNLANGTPVSSPLVTVPLGQFADWVKGPCTVVR